MSGGFKPTDADQQLLSALELSPKLENYPRTVLQLAKLIHELQAQSSAAKTIARKPRSTVEAKE